VNILNRLRVAIGVAFHVGSCALRACFVCDIESRRLPNPKSPIAPDTGNGSGDRPLCGTIETASPPEWGQSLR